MAISRSCSEKLEQKTADFSVAQCSLYTIFAQKIKGSYRILIHVYFLILIQWFRIHILPYPDLCMSELSNRESSSLGHLALPFNSIGLV